MRVRTIIAAVLFLAAACQAAELFDESALRFAEEVDARTLSLLTVQYAGRLAVLDTVARDSLARAYGAQTIDGTAPTFAYLELYFNAGAYLDRPVIYVRERDMRRFVAAHLDEDTRKEFQRAHRLPPAALVGEDALELLVGTERAAMSDLARAGRIASLRAPLGMLSSRPEYRVPLERLSERYSSFLSVGVLRIAPAGGETWIAPDGAAAHGSDAQVSEAAAMLTSWWRLGRAWRARDANEVNRLAALWAEHQSSAAPPKPIRELELLYNRAQKATVLWVGFAAAFVLMLLAVATGRLWVRRAGLAVLAASTLALLAGFAARWVLSGRAWYLPPVMNMFEAVTGSALLGCVLALGLELARRRNYFALSASLYSTAALMFCHFLPASVGAGIAAAHGILNSPVMAAHVTVIILGHAMAGMTLVISVVYLLARLWEAAARASAGLPAGQAAGAGDAIDRCNLIAVQLAAWTLALGTILGAVWADFAWGRWWGWDPKETWALITTLVYIAVLHLRMVLPVRWRGLATAVGCVVGSAAMMFNWVVVNFILPGKHSYA
ncbi:MAG TPA: cytochrome c biogenesis protein CcsA [Phycisphaerae bacterium]|nr:cytochrome c biogenesis protein CcsA [Phycisphaerae bacterium]